MSGAFPTSPVLRDIKITSYTPTLVSQTQSLKRQARSRGGHRWVITGRFPPMRRATMAPVYAFLVNQDGQKETFTFIPPVYGESQGTASGTVTTSGTTSVGATSATITGLTGTLLAGDFIKFQNHDKVYMLTADEAAGTINFKPALMEEVASGQQVVYDSVPFTVALASDSSSFDAVPGDINTLSVTFVEVI